MESNNVFHLGPLLRKTQPQYLYLLGYPDSLITFHNQRATLWLVYVTGNNNT